MKIVSMVFLSLVSLAVRAESGNDLSFEVLVIKYHFAEKVVAHRIDRHRSLLTTTTNDSHDVKNRRLNSDDLIWLSEKLKPLMTSTDKVEKCRLTYVEVTFQPDLNRGPLIICRGKGSANSVLIDKLLSIIEIY